MSNTLNYLRHRFACKRYKDKAIGKAELETILEAGRLSPSSFGLEHWTFHVCRSADLLSSCYYQESMKSAPLTVVITAKREKYFEPYGPFVKERGSRFPGTVQEFIDDYEGYFYFLQSEGRVDEWSRAQCYIAAANMMTCASELGIQSCAIEGYENDKVLSALGLDKAEEEVGLVVAFGYPDEEERPKVRLSPEDVIVYHL